MKNGSKEARTDQLHTVTIGTGVPMLLMHGGLGLDHTYFRPWLDPLSNSVQLLYYDHRGNGRSPAAPGTVLTHDTWIRDADAIRAAAGHDRVLVLGHSYGGYLAQEYALRYPERILGLILISTAPVVDYGAEIVINARRRGTAEEVDTLLAALATPSVDDAAFAQTWQTIAPLYFHDRDATRIAATFQQVTYRALGFNAAMFGCLSTFNTVDRLASMTAPTLIISGSDDFVSPPVFAGARLAAGIPQATHHIIERCGHFPFVEAQEPCVTLIRNWIREQIPADGAQR